MTYKYRVQFEGKALGMANTLEDAHRILSSEISYHMEEVTEDAGKGYTINNVLSGEQLDAWLNPITIFKNKPFKKYSEVERDPEECLCGNWKSLGSIVCTECL